MERLVSGAAFGAALTASGVYQPGAIISQLNLDNFNMMQTFLTATASSSLLVAIATRLDNLQHNLVHKKPSNLNLVGPHDGNIIGGVLLGAGMALAGACPGTVLSQLAAGITSGFYAFGGAIVAGVAWSGWSRRAPSATSPDAVASSAQQAPSRLRKGDFPSEWAFGFQLVCATLVLACAVGGRGSSSLGSIWGGLGIGLAQLVNVALVGNLVGVSGCYREIGNWFWWCLGTGKRASPSSSSSSCPSPATRPAYGSILFATGLLCGAKALLFWGPPAAPAPQVSLSPFPSFIGGLLMATGASIAGGCTSGHGISGMALLAGPSMLTMMATMLTGAVVASSIS